jgi:hypothetical protein
MFKRGVEYDRFGEGAAIRYVQQIVQWPWVAGYFGKVERLRLHKRLD